MFKRLLAATAALLCIGAHADEATIRRNLASHCQPVRFRSGVMARFIIRKVNVQ